MLSLSDVSKFVQGSPGIERFKPWWERGLDLIIVGLFMSLIMIWGRSVLSESFGMVCVSINGDASLLATNDMRFVASVCQQNSSAMTLVSYPYILLLQWLVLVISQNLWLKIPAINARLDTFEGMINDLLKVDPVFITDTSNNQMLPCVEYNEEALPKIKVLNDKFMFILRDSSYVAEMYKWKTIFQNIISLIFLLFASLWIFWIGFFKVDFACEVPSLKYFSNSLGTVTKQPFVSLYACSLGPSIYIYCTMIVHIVSLIVFLFLNIWSLYWFIYNQMTFAERTNIFGESKDDCKGLPGMADLQFCLALLSYNLHDGNYSLEVLKKVFQSREPVGNQQIQKDSPSLLLAKNKVKGFEDGCFMIIYLLNELNLYEIPNLQDLNHLFNCFEEIFKNLNRINLNVVTGMRKTIVDELIANSHKYRNFFNSWKKQLFKLHENRINVSFDNYDFQTYVQLMKNDCTFGDHLCLLVTAELLKVRIIIIRPAGDKSLPDDYYPLDKEPYIAIFLMTYLPPLLFHATKETNVQFSNNFYGKVVENHNKLRRFIDDEKYRSYITEQALRYASAPNDDKEMEITSSIDFQTANTLHTFYTNKLKQKIDQQRSKKIDNNHMGKKRYKDSVHMRKPCTKKKSNVNATFTNLRRFSYGSNKVNNESSKKYDQTRIKRHSTNKFSVSNLNCATEDSLSMIALFNEYSNEDLFEKVQIKTNPLKVNRKVNFININ